MTMLLLILGELVVVAHYYDPYRVITRCVRSIEEYYNQMICVMPCVFSDRCFTPVMVGLHTCHLFAAMLCLLLHGNFQRYIWHTS